MPIHQFPKHSQCPAPGTVKDLEELHTIAVPRDSVWEGVCVCLLCAVVKPLAQMVARTTRGPEATRMLREDSAEFLLFLGSLLL